MKVPPLRMSRAEAREELDRIRHPFRVAIDRAKNPFNVGTIIRTAHSFLVQEVLLVGSDPWYERAAMGMHRFERLVELEDPLSLVAYAEERGLPLVPFEKERSTVALWDAELAEDAILVFGNEDDGVDARVIEAAREVVAIPMYGVNHSYPVSVAAGMGMAEWARRRYARGRLLAPRTPG